MKKSEIDLNRLRRPVLIVFILIVLIFIIYLRFIKPEIISNLISGAFEYNPFLLFIILLISIPVVISTSLWLIRYGKNRGSIGKLFSSLIALKLGIVLIFVVLAFLLFILWVLVKLLQYLK